MPTLKALKRRRGGGHELLAYRNGRAWVDVRAADINDYLQAVTGAEFTAKDFRTWNATVLAAVELAVRGDGAQLEDGPQASRDRGDQDGRRLPLQHPRRLPRRLHRPAGLRPPRRRARRSPPRWSGSSRGTDPGEFPDREQIERAVLRLIG